jgi:hypothetical protein
MPVSSQGSESTYLDPASSIALSPMRLRQLGRGRCCRSQPVSRSLRPARVTPDVVALSRDAADDRLGVDGSGQRVLRAQLKLLSEEPAIRAAAPRNSASGFVVRNSEKILVAALEEVGGSHIALHGWALVASL